MAEPVSQTGPRRAMLLVALLLLLGSACASVFAAAPTVSASAEDLYDALLKPSLADDGRISSAERQAILAAARKLLDDQQLQELERRIAAHTVEAVPQPASILPDHRAPARNDDLPAPPFA